MFTKKRLGLITGLVALAMMAIPAFASAHVLTDELGNPLTTPSEVFATSTNAKTTTAVGQLTCKHVEIAGTLTTNNGSTVEVGGLGPDSAVECHRTTTEATEEVFVEPVFEGLHLVTGGGTSSASFTYEVEFPKLGGLVCHFKGTVDVTVVGGGILAAGEIAGTTGGLCPKAGNFSGNFALSNANGAVTVD